MMKIIEDLYNNRNKQSVKFNGDYLKKNKEQSWFFSFLKKLGMIDENHVWIGPDIKDLNKQKKYFRFVTILYENRVAYSRFEDGEEEDDREVSNEEIPGFVSNEETVQSSETTTKCITIPMTGMYFLDVGPNRTRYIVNVNKESSSIWPAGSEV